MPFVQSDHVIEQVAPAAAYPAFRHTVQQKLYNSGAMFLP
jgi:hypothetical protein